MKVYAEYIEKDGLFFRRNTLLQFGNSWDLIGNVVLANPGSADPINEASDEALASISKFYIDYRNGEHLLTKNWHEFTPDSTMCFVEKIFSGWYIGKNIKLDGVLQLFNTFNIKNKNLQEAVTQIKISSDLLFSNEIYNYFNDKPTYFGFSNDVINDEILCKVAMHIFENSSDEVRSIYNSDFTKNSFYHPMYVNRAYGQPNFKKYKDGVLSAIVNKYISDF